MQISKSVTQTVAYKAEFANIEYLASKMPYQEECNCDADGKYHIHLKSFEVKPIGLQLKPMFQGTPVQTANTITAQLEPFELSVSFGGKTLSTLNDLTLSMTNDVDAGKSTISVTLITSVDGLPFMFKAVADFFVKKLLEGYVKKFVENLQL